MPTRKRCEFDELMYRGAMSEQASDALRFALGVDRACAQLRKFEVITGGVIESEVRRVLSAHPSARLAVRKESCALCKELLTVGHEMTGILGAGVHLLSQPFLIS